MADQTIERFLVKSNSEGGGSRRNSFSTEQAMKRKKEEGESEVLNAELLIEVVTRLEATMREMKEEIKIIRQENFEWKSEINKLREKMEEKEKELEEKEKIWGKEKKELVREIEQVKQEIEKKKKGEL